MQTARHDENVETLVKKLRDQSFSENPPTIDVEESFKILHTALRPVELWVPLRILTTPETQCDVLVKSALAGVSRNTETDAHLILAAREYLIPFLPEYVKERARDAFRPHLLPKNWPTDSYAQPIIFIAAGVVNMRDELLAVIKSIPDTAYTKAEEWAAHYHKIQDIVFSLNDPAIVEGEFRRLKLKLKTPDYIRAWLAHTEYRALDYVAESINAEGNREEAAKLVDVLALVQAPEAAGPMLEVYLKSKAPRLAREWFDAHPGHAIAGLLTLLANKNARALHDAALEILNAFKRKGMGDSIEAALAKMPADTAAKLRGEVDGGAIANVEPHDEKGTPDWLKESLAETTSLKAKVPAWANASNLPPIMVDGKRLNDEQVGAVLKALQAPQGPGREELPKDEYYELMRNAATVDNFVRTMGWGWNRRDDHQFAELVWAFQPSTDQFRAAQNGIERIAGLARQVVKDSDKKLLQDLGKEQHFDDLLLPIMMREYFRQYQRAGCDAKEALRMANRGMAATGYSHLRYSIENVLKSDTRLKQLGLDKIKEQVAAEVAKNPPPPKKTGISFHPLIADLRDNAEEASLDAFGWRLFELWLGEGAPSKEKWAFTALAAFGGDKTVLKLTPMIRVWPGESQHQRAVTGLEILRQIGTDTALMQLNGMAQKLPFKGLKDKANVYMEAIAKDKGLTKAQLEDRVVPDCDLDERGGCVFDFGPRKFSFLLGTEMKPMVRDEAGNMKADLPAPNSKDDPELSKQAVEKWKLMKKQIKEVAKIQAVRLEQAMVISRRWSGKDFDTLVVKHPLMFNLARLLLWGGYASDGKLLACFRVTDEQDYANEKDEPVTLSKFTAIGLVHPLQMTEADKSAWGQMLTDYGVIPPFPQLGRTVYRLEKAEEKADEIKRFEHMKLPAPTLVFGLEKLGWQRGAAQDGGCFFEHTKVFEAAQLTAVVEYEGSVAMGYIDPNEMLDFKSVYFYPCIYVPESYAWKSDEKKQPLKDVDPIVISETINDMQVLAAKVKA